MPSKTALTVLAIMVGLSGHTVKKQEKSHTPADDGTAAIAMIESITQQNPPAAGPVIAKETNTIQKKASGNTWSTRMEEQLITMQQATYGTDIRVARTRSNLLKLLAPGDSSFHSGRAQLSPRFAETLDRLATNLNRNPNTTIGIVGHTDMLGSDDDNLRLSRQRARNVGKHLIRRGVSPNRIVVEGRGAHKPIASNVTPEGRAQNRRVEIFVAELAHRY